MVLFLTIANLKLTKSEELRLLKKKLLTNSLNKQVQDLDKL